MSKIAFAYYCSGHGFGHATRVSAFATHLCQMEQTGTVYIVSSAPKHVFSQAISHGAIYRCAIIDPVIVQPLAYHVDRRKSVDVLENFLLDEEKKTEEEAAWLKANGVDCVLSDAAYLACKAANAAGIPSALITNFTFDSVYSYLSIQFPKSSSYNPLFLPEAAGRHAPHNQHHAEIIPPHDEPIPPEELGPLVTKLQEGYRCAELLIRLPGNIPIPSFSMSPALPSYLWTDPEKNTFIPDVMSSLSRDISSESLHPSIPFPPASNRTKRTPRRIVQSPLIVRHPSPDVYTPAGRKRVLDYVGVPERLQGIDTKILIVSFGGQVFRKPSSRYSSRSHSPTPRSRLPSPLPASRTSSTDSNGSTGSPDVHLDDGHLLRAGGGYVDVRQTIATPSHLWIPGAPPANKARTSPATLSTSRFLSPSSPPEHESCKVPRIELERHSSFDSDTDSEERSSEEPPQSDAETDITEPEALLLPDASWIAIVCGATASPKGPNGETEEDELPENFFVAPRDVYMPDLTAVADVLLGKLGYGTVSECVDACTPFVYVPRPLFIEEHGLRRLLNNEGVGVELSREQYEAGDWAASVHEAWLRGRLKKAWKRKVGETGERRREGERMARELVEWVKEWQRADAGGEAVASV